MNGRDNHWHDQDSRPNRKPSGSVPLHVVVAGLLLLSLLAASTQALAQNTVYQWPPGAPGTDPLLSLGGWPTAWTSIASFNDPDDGAPATIEFVGDANNPGFYIGRTASYLFFRIRVKYSSTVSTTPDVKGHYSPFDGNTVMVVFNNGATFGTPNWGFAWDFKEDATGHGMEMMTFNSSVSVWNKTDMQDVDGWSGGRQEPDIDAGTRTTDAFVRTVDSVPPVAGGTVVTANTTFIDIAIRCGYLNSKVGTSILSGTRTMTADCGQSWQMQLVSIQNANDHAKITGDVASGKSPSDPVSLNGPTYAIVSDFSAAAFAGQVVLKWDTQIEAGTLGFKLERQTALGEFEPVHQGLIPGRGPAGEGGTYRLVDATALPGFTYTYRLTEVEANGNRREVGRYTVTPEAESESVQAAQIPMRLLSGEAAFNPREPNADEKARLTARYRERVKTQQESLVACGSAVSPAKEAYKAAIGVKEAGLYFVGAGELDQALGWPKGKASGLIQARQLRLTNQGNKISWLPAPDYKGFYFYGEASKSIYDVENVYVAQQGPGTLMTSAKVRATGAAGADSFLSTVTAEQNLFAATVRAKDSEEDYWFWAMFNASRDCASEADSCRTHQFTIEAPAAASSGSARLVVKLRGNSSLPPEPDHRLSVSMNGTAIGEGHWDGLTDYSLSLPFDQALLHAGANTVRVDALLDTGVDYNYFYLDRFELTYQRAYQASDDQLRATGPANRRIVANGFRSNAISLFDLTDVTRPKTVVGARIDGLPGNYRVGFVPASSTTPYLMLTSAAIRLPGSLRAMQTTELGNRNAGAEYLLIGPDDFAESAQHLVNFRANQGLSGKFVPLQAIYDEYAAGQKTPHAIKNFLAYALRHWRVAPKYVLLGGKGTFDPKDFLGYGTDRLPVLMALTEAGVIASDQRFVDRDGDGIGDIPIGRLPAVTAAEFSAMVNRLIVSENPAGPQSRRVVLLADGADVDGNFAETSEAMAAQLLLAGYADEEIQRLYLDEMSFDTIRGQLFQALNSGVRLLNYFGHSGVTELAHGLLTASDVASLTNLDHLPVMAGMTCYMNRFEFPALTSLGESLLLNPKGGAVAVWSSGGWSYNSQAGQLDEGFFKALFESGANTVGDAAFKAISEYVKAGNATDTASVYNFLGDPASRWQ